MTATTHPAPPPPTPSAEKAITLALRLAHAENALHALTSGQVDAIVDSDGGAYLLRPAQEHLRASEKRLQAVLESMADVITVVNRSGIILSQSQAVRRVLGYEPDELVGSSIFELIYAGDVDRLYIAFFNVIEGFQENATAQFHHPTRNGSLRLLEATVGKLRDSSPPSVVFCLRPFTDPRQGRTEPTMPGALDMLAPGENGDSTMLSHRRRIPITGTQIAIGGTESTAF